MVFTNFDDFRVYCRILNNNSAKKMISSNGLRFWEIGDKSSTYILNAYQFALLYANYGFEVECFHTVQKTRVSSKFWPFTFSINFVFDTLCRVSLRFKKEQVVYCSEKGPFLFLRALL